jgi:type IV pilus assembly protein PilO
MDKLLTQRKPLIVVAALACLVVLAAGWFLLISPQRQKVVDLQAQVDQQESTNDSTRSQIASLQALSAQLPAQRAKLAAMKGKVPDQPQLPELVRLLSAAADESGVQLVGITPNAPVAIPGTDGLSGIDVVLKVSGSYVALEQYELALEGLSRAFLVSGVQVADGAAGSSGAAASGSSAGASTTAGALTTTITGRVLVGPTPAPAAGAATSGTGATAPTTGTS